VAEVLAKTRPDWFPRGQEAAVPCPPRRPQIARGSGHAERRSMPSGSPGQRGQHTVGNRMPYNPRFLAPLRMGEVLPLHGHSTGRGRASLFNRSRKPVSFIVTPTFFPRGLPGW
jgi:hypothetical protein